MHVFLSVDEFALELDEFIRKQKDDMVFTISILLIIVRQCVGRKMQRGFM